MKVLRLATCRPVSHGNLRQWPASRLCSRRRRYLSTAATDGPASQASEPKVIFSGIQPTGVPHLGNYLGALQQWTRFQHTEPRSTRLLYSLVDLHAITIKQSPSQLRQWRMESLAALLAIGLDPNRSAIFFQSAVPAHTELMWILSCSATVARLSHMTQWKSKLNLPDNAKPALHEAPLQLGLFTYPVLQAADILVHGATHVPVGHDQAQHLEYARGLAQAFNHQYSAPGILTEPTTVLSRAKRIMSLADPQRKMSKSDSNAKSRILISDSKEEIERKVRAAVTDSEDGVTYDPVGRPGVANLVDIVLYLQEAPASEPATAGSAETEASSEATKAESTSTEAEAHAQAAHTLLSGISNKSSLKHLASSTVDAHLAPIRARYLDLLNNEQDYLVDVAEEGGEMARASAAATMERVKRVVGFD